MIRITKVIFWTLVLGLWATGAEAQESQKDYNFLRLPVSAHSAGLGGENVSLVVDDPTLMFANPALASSVSDKTLNLNIMRYMQGVLTGSASFTKILGSRSTLGIGAQFIDFGKMKETDVDNRHTGDFTARDMAFSGVFAYNLSDKIAGGISAKAIYSHIGGYSSFALGVDLGLNYFDGEKDLSLSLVARNLGGQLKAYYETYEALPFVMQAGVTKRLIHTPLRPSITFTDITDWDHKKLIEHLIIGTDILIGETFYVCGAYNFKRAEDMKLVDGGTHGAGLSLGAGLTLKKFKMHIAYAKYHVASTSLMLNLCYSL